MARLTAVLLSLITLASAIPLETASQLRLSETQVGDLFQAGLNSYYSSLSTEDLYSLSVASVAASQTQSAPKACEDIWLVFARGTFEPANDNALGAVVGYTFNRLLKEAFGGRYGATGVDYNNDVGGYLAGGDRAGSTKMAQMIKDKAAQCPSTKIIVSGYSQGAQLAHNALNQIRDSSVKSKVAAVIVFGDPNKGKAITGISSDKIYTNCASDDPICMGIPVPLGSHLTYGSDTEGMKKVINFIKAHV